MTLHEAEEAKQEVQQFVSAVQVPNWLAKARNWILSKVFKITVDKNNPEKTVEQIIAKLQQLVGSSDVTNADPITESYKYDNAIDLLSEDWALEMDYIINNLDQIQEYVTQHPERLQEGLPKGLGKTLLRMAIPILLITACSFIGPVPALIARFAMPLYGVIKAIGGARKAARVAQQAASPKVEQEVQQANTDTPIQSQFLSKVTSDKWRQFFLGVPDSRVLQDWAKQQISNPSVRDYIQLGIRLMQADLQNAKSILLPEPTQKQFTRSTQWLGQL